MLQKLGLQIGAELGQHPTPVLGRSRRLRSKKGAQELAKNQRIDGILCGDQDFIACSPRRIILRQVHLNTCRLTGIPSSSKSRRRVCATQ